MTHNIGKNAKGTHVMCLVDKDDFYTIHFVQNYEELTAFCAARFPDLPEVWRVVLKHLEEMVWHRGTCVSEGIRFLDVNLAESVVLPAVVSQPEILGVLGDIALSLRSASKHLEHISHKEPPMRTGIFGE